MKLKNESTNQKLAEASFHQNVFLKSFKLFLDKILQFPSIFKFGECQSSLFPYMKGEGEFHTT